MEFYVKNKVRLSKIKQQNFQFSYLDMELCMQHNADE